MNPNNPPLFWAGLFLFCALAALLTYPKKAPQAASQPLPPPAPIVNPLPDQDRQELEYLRKKEREYQRGTNPYFHKEITPDPPTEALPPEPEPPKFEVPQRYRDMGLARFQRGLARFKMGQEKWEETFGKEEEKK